MQNDVKNFGTRSGSCPPSHPLATGLVEAICSIVNDDDDYYYDYLDNYDYYDS